MNENNNKTSFRVIYMVLGILSVLLILNLVYMFKVNQGIETFIPKTNTTSKKISKSDLEYTLSQKDTMMKNLAKLKMVCDKVIAQNTSMSSELSLEREKVIALMAELKQSAGSATTIAKFKQTQNKIGGSVKNLLIVDKVKLPTNIVFETKIKTEPKPKKIITKIAETPIVIKTVEIIPEKKIETPKTIEKPVRVSLSKVLLTAFRETSSGNKEETDKANKANFLKVSFAVYVDNPSEKKGYQTYYVQIIDSRNNVLGKKKTQFFVDKSLTYSFETSIKIENPVIQVNEFLPGQNFEKGTYYLNIFDKDELMAKTTFVFK